MGAELEGRICWCKIHKPIQIWIYNNWSLMKGKCHLRLKINTMELHHPHSPKKWQRVSKITIRIHYYRPHSNFHSGKNTWTLNLRGGIVRICWCKIHNPIQIWIYNKWSLMKDRCHLRLIINTLVPHLPYPPQKWQRVSKNTIEYTATATLKFP